MTDAETQFEDAGLQVEQDLSQSEAEQFDAYRSTIRLLVGLVLIGGDSLIGRLREWEAANPQTLPAGAAPDAGDDTARRALIGLVFATAETVRQVVWDAAGLSASVACGMWSVLSPIANSALIRPFWSPVRSLASYGQTRLERHTRIGRSEEQRSRKLAEVVSGRLVEDIVTYVGNNPGVKALVDAQVAGLATRSETLDPLVREVGDRYIAYLNEHPEDVQNLVQGQAAGMAAEIRDDVRSMTVTGDTFLETLTRRLLRRTPREDLPPPPPEVRRQAVQRQVQPGALTDDVRYLKEV